MLSHSPIRAHTLVSKYVAIQMHIKKSFKGPVINFNSIFSATGTDMDPQFQQNVHVKMSLPEAFEQGVDVFVGRCLAP